MSTYQSKSIFNFHQTSLQFLWIHQKFNFHLSNRVGWLYFQINLYLPLLIPIFHLRFTERWHIQDQECHLEAAIFCKLLETNTLRRLIIITGLLLIFPMSSMCHSLCDRRKNRKVEVIRFWKFAVTSENIGSLYFIQTHTPRWIM